MLLTERRQKPRLSFDSGTDRLMKRWEEQQLSCSEIACGWTPEIPAMPGLCPTGYSTLGSKTSHEAQELIAFILAVKNNSPSAKISREINNVTL
jgi:hypothetical protein